MYQDAQKKREFGQRLERIASEMGDGYLAEFIREGNGRGCIDFDKVVYHLMMTGKTDRFLYNALEGIPGANRILGPVLQHSHPSELADSIEGVMGTLYRTGDIDAAASVASLSTRYGSRTLKRFMQSASAAATGENPDYVKTTVACFEQPSVGECLSQKQGADLGKTLEAVCDVARFTHDPETVGSVARAAMKYSGDELELLTRDVRNIAFYTGAGDVVTAISERAANGTIRDFASTTYTVADRLVSAGAKRLKLSCLDQNQPGFAQAAREAIGYAR